MKLKVNIFFVYTCLFALSLITISSILNYIGIADKNKEIFGIIWFLAIILIINLVCLGRDNKYQKYSYMTLAIAEILLSINYISGFADKITIDSTGFKRIAAEYYQHDFCEHSTYFPYVIFYGYKVFGQNNFIVYQMGILCTVLSVICLINTFDILKIDSRIQEPLILIAVFTPCKYLYCITAMREPIYLLSIGLSFMYIVKWKKEYECKNIIIAIITLIPAIILHTGFTTVLISYIFIFLFSKDITRSSKVFIIMMIICSMTMILVNSKSNYLHVSTSVIDSLESYNAYNSVAGSAYLGWMHMSNFEHLVLYTPIRLFYFWLSPLPSGWDDYRKLFAFLFDSSIYMVSFISCVLMLLEKKKYDTMFNNILGCIICLLVIGLVSFAWGTIAAGTAIRHRNSMVNIAFIPIAMYLQGHSKSILYNKKSAWLRNRQFAMHTRRGSSF